MGDVIHALPVVSDILRADPDASVDWVVEEPFVPLVQLHPGVNEILPVALRRWRRQWRDPLARKQFAAVRADLKARHYDLILDLQGLLKSAWVARWVNGPRAGYNRACARESLAALSYQRRYPVDMQTHAIEKMRSLAGQALGYSVEGEPDFQLQVVAPTWSDDPSVKPASPYWVFLHATSRPEKLWPADTSVNFLQLTRARGVPVLLPWGSESERVAANQLVSAAGHGTVLDRLDLGRCATLLAQAQAVIGVDTGLTHLAAALDRPTVALFSATEAFRYGPYWSARAKSLGRPGQWPRADQVTEALDTLLAQP